MKEVDAIRHAVANLRLVATALHVPLDTSELDKALAAFLDATAPKTVKPAADK